MATSSYQAEWVFSDFDHPLKSGVVEVTQGSISAIHQKSVPSAIDLGPVAILPTLVNAHTHLEFSDLQTPLLPAEPFPDWIRSLVRHRNTRSLSLTTICQDGFQQSYIAGTQLLGEIATDGWSPNSLSLNEDSLQDGFIPPHVIAFREILGLSPSGISEQLTTAENFLAANQACEHPQLMSSGLSPHAPYSVHPELYRGLIALCEKHHCPAAVHLAESPAEMELLERGTGDFVDLLQGFQVWQDGIFPRPGHIREYIEPLTKLTRSLVIHGNYLSGEEIDLLAQHPQVTVVYCPRTHAFFGHPEHPWQQLQDAGVRVALGTDSRASNPNLSLWEEVLFLKRKFPKVSPQWLLKMATRDGAVSLLGEGTDWGLLEVGRAARWSVVPLLRPDASDPYHALFSA